MIVEFLELTFSRHDTCNLLCDTSLALARSSPTRRYTGSQRALMIRGLLMLRRPLIFIGPLPVGRAPDIQKGH